MLDWLINFVNTYIVPFAIDLFFAAVILIVGFALTSFIMKRIKKSKGSGVVGTKAQQGYKGKKIGCE